MFSIVQDNVDNVNRTSFVPKMRNLLYLYVQKCFCHILAFDNPLELVHASVNSFGNFSRPILSRLAYSFCLLPFGSRNWDPS